MGALCEPIDHRKHEDQSEHGDNIRVPVPRHEGERSPERTEDGTNSSRE